MEMLIISLHLTPQGSFQVASSSYQAALCWWGVQAGGAEDPRELSEGLQMLFLPLVGTFGKHWSSLMSAGLNTALAQACCALFVEAGSDVGSVVVLLGEVRRSWVASWHAQDVC